MKRTWVALEVAAVGASVLVAVLWLAPKGSGPTKRTVRHRTVAVTPPSKPEPEVALSPAPPPLKRAKKAASETPPSEAPMEPEETESNLAAETAEFCVMLDLSERTAAEIVRLLGERDLEAERILEVYGGPLSVEAIVTVGPRLRMLDAETDRAIEAMLTQEQQGHYRKMRSEGVIAGTVLDVPPALSPEEAHDGE